MGAKKPVYASLLAIFLLLASGIATARGFIQNPELLDKIKIGVTTDKEVEQILGPPASRMDYTMAGDMGKNRIDVGIMIDKAGIVRDIQRIPQYRGG
jgi:hypothetical protein